ncbi:hypothetical protein D9M68_821350 [compost metagenome]
MIASTCFRRSSFISLARILYASPNGLMVSIRSISSSSTLNAILRMPSISAVLPDWGCSSFGLSTALACCVRFKTAIACWRTVSWSSSVSVGYLSLMIFPRRTCVSSCGTSSSSNRPRSIDVLSWTKAAITSLRSSWQMRAASSLLGCARPLISTRISPVF